MDTFLIRGGYALSEKQKKEDREVTSAGKQRRLIIMTMKQDSL